MAVLRRRGPDSHWRVQRSHEKESPAPEVLVAAGEDSFEPWERAALAPQNRRGRTVDGRDFSTGREFIKNLGRGRLDHRKASGERGSVCFRQHNTNAPPLMASQSGAHAEIVGTSGSQ